VTTSPGDQVAPAVDGGVVAFNDLGRSPDGWVVTRQLGGNGGEVPVYGPGVWAGPDLDEGFVAWQDSDSRVCRRSMADGARSCVTSTPASDLSLSGAYAVTGERDGGSTISRVDFTSGRSRKLDSYSRNGMRYDPDVEGQHAVWVRMRGYSTRYYEPLLVDYDLSDGSWSYLTQVGGGMSSSGDSLYQRGEPDIDDDRVIYQQKLNEPGQTWDIFQAVPGTPGSPVVQEPGDQINPVTDGNILVYQDNRAGHLDDQGRWVGEWDLYVRDLDTGQEQLLCGASGDQVNPDIDGNTVVWQDNRNGDWDIYSAELAPWDSMGVKPVLGLSIRSVFWRDMMDYQAGMLSVTYGISNYGDVPALDVAVRQVQLTPDSVQVAGELPPPADRFEVGGCHDFTVRFMVPPGISHFHTALFASCLDKQGGEIWFPQPPP